MTFEGRLRAGKAGEGLVARWLRRRGWNVLPVYETEIHEGKGPQLFRAQGDPLICADMLIFRGAQEIRWVEAKRKSAFTWHRLTSRWVTGIDLRHFEDYMQLASLSPWPFWLLFLHERGRAKDTPEDKVSPAGLFGEELRTLAERESHRFLKCPSPMVYWGVDDLRKMADIEEFEEHRIEKLA